MKPRYAGELRRTRSQRTGTVVSVFDAPVQGLDAGGEWAPGAASGIGLPGEDGWKPWCWATDCEDHGATCGHTTLADAKSAAPKPDGWCEDCRELRADRGLPLL
jgi:hypothetical protein